MDEPIQDIGFFSIDVNSMHYTTRSALDLRHSDSCICLCLVKEDTKEKIFIPQKIDRQASLIFYTAGENFKIGKLKEFNGLEIFTLKEKN